MLGQGKKTGSLLAYKENLAEIAHYDKQIEEALALNRRKQNSFEAESSTEHIGNPYNFSIQPSEDELEQQEVNLRERVSMTLDLANLTIVQSEVNIMITSPVVRKPVPEDDVLWEVTAECKIDLVPFTILFHEHAPFRKFAPKRYSHLEVNLLKSAHKKELARSILPTLEVPDLAMQVLQNYATALRSRRTTLQELAEMYADELDVQAMPEGGYRVRCLDLLQLDWTLENPWSPNASFWHRMKFEIVYMPEEYLRDIAKLYKQFEDPSLETKERTRVLSIMFNICLQAAAPTRELQESFESDPETAGRLHERRTTLDHQPDVPHVEHSPKKPSGRENKHQNRKTDMAPPNAIPKKSKKVDKYKGTEKNDAQKSKKDESNIDNGKGTAGLKGGSNAQDKESETGTIVEGNNTGKESTVYANEENIGIGSENEMNKRSKVPANKGSDKGPVSAKGNSSKKTDGEVVKAKTASCETHDVMTNTGITNEDGYSKITSDASSKRSRPKRVAQNKDKTKKDKIIGKDNGVPKDTEIEVNILNSKESETGTIVEINNTEKESTVYANEENIGIGSENEINKRSKVPANKGSDKGPVSAKGNSSKKTDGKVVKAKTASCETHDVMTNTGITNEDGYSKITSDASSKRSRPKRVAQNKDKTKKDKIIEKDNGVPKDTEIEVNILNSKESETGTIVEINNTEKESTVYANEENIGIGSENEMNKRSKVSANKGSDKGPVSAKGNSSKKTDGKVVKAKTASCETHDVMTNTGITNEDGYSKITSDASSKRSRPKRVAQNKDKTKKDKIIEKDNGVPKDTEIEVNILNSKESETGTIVEINNTEKESTVYANEENIGIGSENEMNKRSKVPANKGSDKGPVSAKGNSSKKTDGEVVKAKTASCETHDVMTNTGITNEDGYSKITSDASSKRSRPKRVAQNKDKTKKDKIIEKDNGVPKDTEIEVNILNSKESETGTIVEINNIEKESTVYANEENIGIGSENEMNKRSKVPANKGSDKGPVSAKGNSSKKTDGKVVKAKTASCETHDVMTNTGITNEDGYSKITSDASSKRSRPKRVAQNKDKTKKDKIIEKDNGVPKDTEIEVNILNSKESETGTIVEINNTEKESTVYANEENIGIGSENEMNKRSKVPANKGSDKGPVSAKGNSSKKTDGEVVKAKTASCETHDVMTNTGITNEDGYSKITSDASSKRSRPKRVAQNKDKTKKDKIIEKDNGVPKDTEIEVNILNSKESETGTIVEINNTEKESTVYANEENIGIGSENEMNKRSKVPANKGSDKGLVSAKGNSSKKTDGKVVKAKTASCETHDVMTNTGITNEDGYSKITSDASSKRSRPKRVAQNKDKTKKDKKIEKDNGVPKDTEIEVNILNSKESETGTIVEINNTEKESTVYANEENIGIGSENEMNKRSKVPANKGSDKGPVSAEGNSSKKTDGKVAKAKTASCETHDVMTNTGITNEDGYSKITSDASSKRSRPKRVAQNKDKTKKDKIIEKDNGVPKDTEIEDNILNSKESESGTIVERNNTGKELTVYANEENIGIGSENEMNKRCKVPANKGSDKGPVSAKGNSSKKTDGEVVKAKTASCETHDVMTNTGITNEDGYSKITSDASSKRSRPKRVAQNKDKTKKDKIIEKDNGVPKDTEIEVNSLNSKESETGTIVEINNTEKESTVYANEENIGIGSENEINKRSKVPANKGSDKGPVSAKGNSSKKTDGKVVKAKTASCETRDVMTNTGITNEDGYFKITSDASSKRSRPKRVAQNKDKTKKDKIIEKDNGVPKDTEIEVNILNSKPAKASTSKTSGSDVVHKAKTDAPKTMTSQNAEKKKVLKKTSDKDLKENKDNTGTKPGKAAEKTRVTRAKRVR